MSAGGGARRAAWRLATAAACIAALHGAAACGSARFLALPQLIGWHPRLRPDSTERAGGAVLVGAGDIGFCRLAGDAATSKLLDQIAGTVFTAGDNAYPDGGAAAYARCFAPTWGRHRERIRPTPGNHEYQDGRGDAYFAYFGDRAGEPGKGWYSYDLGAWHVIALNSNVAMAAGSEQERWLRADVAAHPVRCTLAYWHHPLFSSSPAASPAARPLWMALYEGGAEVIVGGHHHAYERFAPQTPDGVRDDTHGVREFVVGTGGAGLDRFGRRVPHSQRRLRLYGVLKLQLFADHYLWRLVSTRGRVRDSGRGECH